MTDPIKWRKYLLLVQFGLTSKAILNKQIKRYKQIHASKMIADLSASIQLDTPQLKYLHVIKIVQKNAVGQLKNFRLTDLNQWCELLAFLQLAQPSDEIWHCKTDISYETLSVAGRIIFDNRTNSTQILEQVWRTSPRLIESYSKGKISTFAYPYIHAIRPTWGWHFRIDNIHIPPDYPSTQNQLLEEGRKSIRLIERSRELIETFVCAATYEDVSTKVIGIEYKIINEKLTIIDWDTADDLSVIERLQH